MESIGAPEKSVNVEVPEGISGIDWYLVGTDSTAGCLFVVGLFALLVGLSEPGLGLWAACVWLGWRVLAYLRTAPADAVRLRQYVNRRVTTDGIAQVLAIVLGLYLATSGQPWLALGVWVVAAGGIACGRGQGMDIAKEAAMTKLYFYCSELINRAAYEAIQIPRLRLYVSPSRARVSKEGRLLRPDRGTARVRSSFAVSASPP